MPQDKTPIVPDPQTPNPEGDPSIAPVIGSAFIPKPDPSVSKIAPAAAPAVSVASVSPTPVIPPAPVVPIHPADAVLAGTIVQKIPSAPVVQPAPAPVPQTAPAVPPASTAAPTPAAPVAAPIASVPTPPPASIAPTQPVAPVIPAILPTPAPVVTPPAPASVAPSAQTGAGHVDLSKVLLPKKEIHTSASAQRVNAADILANEAVPMTPTAAPIAPAPLPPKPAEETLVKPLQTYRGDIEGLVEGKNVSMVNIAAAEADRRAAAAAAHAAPSDAPAEVPEPKGRSVWLTVELIIGGILLIAVSVGALAYFLTRPTSVPVIETPQSPFILTDATSVVEFTISDTAFRRASIMAQLERVRQNTKLSLGLIGRILPATKDSGQLQEIPAQTLLQALVPNMPAELLRTLEPTYLLGVHSFDENQSFLILRADLYETAYRGMLLWERSMREDLLPLFGRTPPVQPKEEAVPLDIPMATTTATSTSDTTATSTATTTPAVPQRPIDTSFVDKTIENRDARAVLNEFGDILLLWMFIDRNTILITTNEYTMKEVINRLQSAPVIPLPQ